MKNKKHSNNNNKHSMHQKKNNHLPAVIIAILFIVVFVLLFILGTKYFFFTKHVPKYSANAIENIAEPKDRYIAHAGGTIDGITYTNSREAINSSYKKGFRFFEVDINVKVDGKLILGHDESAFIKNLFTDLKPPLTLEKIKNAPKKYNYMPIDDLMEWIRKHPDTYFLLDAKGDCINKYKAMIAENEDIMGQLIPYVYSSGDYEACKALGFEAIMYGDYLGREDVDEIMPYLLKQHEAGTLVGIALKDAPEERVKVLSTFAKGNNMRIYYWTVDDKNRAEELMGQGAYGIITDVLI